MTGGEYSVRGFRVSDKDCPLATSGSTFRRAIPACPKCGGPTKRRSLSKRKCENCRTTSTITITADPHDSVVRWQMH